MIARNIGVTSFNIATSVNLVIAQRQQDSVRQQKNLLTFHVKFTWAQVSHDADLDSWTIQFMSQ
jgi:type II secretory ATPase GspE/PulE/Tfp pilus assembly ATPase PilB-like protein